MPVNEVISARPRATPFVGIWKLNEVLVTGAGELSNLPGRSERDRCQGVDEMS